MTIASIVARMQSSHDPSNQSIEFLQMNRQQRCLCRFIVDHHDTFEFGSKRLISFSSHSLYPRPINNNNDTFSKLRNNTSTPKLRRLVRFASDVVTVCQIQTRHRTVCPSTFLSFFILLLLYFILVVVVVDWMTR